MKVKLVLLSIIGGAAISASAQYRVIDGKVHAMNDGSFSQLTGIYEVTDIHGADLTCQPVFIKTVTFKTQDYNKHGVGSTGIKTYAGGQIILKNFGARFQVGYDIANMPLWAVSTGQSPIVASAADYITDKYGKNICQGGKQQMAMVYDFGVPYSPPAKPLTEAQIEARKTVAAKAFQSVEDEAEQGDPGAEYSVAIRYLNGNGCETNHEQAVYWLKRANASGYLDASNKLASLQ